MTDEITPGNRCTKISTLETSVCLGFARNTEDILPLNWRLFLYIMSAPTSETVWSLDEVSIELAGKRADMLREKQIKIIGLVTRAWKTLR